ncbi:MAG: GNAT family N-acetyltransferase [Flavobacteriaceae bacterium]
MPFDFFDELIFENARVLIRPLKENDSELVESFTKSEPDLWQFSLTSPVGENSLKAYISNALKLRTSAQGYPFLVIDKKSKSVAGSTRFYNVDLHHKTLSIGYTWYGKAFQRTGLNRHCKLLLLSAAFEDFGMERVEFRADARNKKSINAMLGIGCVFEGTLRNNCSASSGRRDSVVLSIIKTDWEKAIKAALLKKIV